MKRSILFILAAVLFAACGGTVVDNKAPNTNTGNSNTAKSGPAPPTKEALLARESKAFEAWKNKDGKYFEDFLADNFVGFDEKGNRIGKAAAVKMITESKCDVKSSVISDEQMTPVDADTAVLTLKATQDYTCDGKTGPPVAWGATVFTRSGDTWKAVYHNEIPVTDPKAAPPPPPPVSAPAAKPADTKPAVDQKPTDPVTESYLAAVKKGWEAWKNRDAAAFENIVTKDIVVIDTAGNRFDKAGAIKSWTVPKCDIKGYSLTDASGISLSKTSGLLTLKGTADGSCEGAERQIEAIWGTYVLVKDGDTWKAAMIFETPA